MKKYETTFILDGTLNESSREALISKFSDSIEKLGGDLERVLRWGQRIMAYQIKKRTHGYYVIFYHSMDASKINDFHRELDLNESVLRYMTLEWDGRQPEYIRDETTATQRVEKVPEAIPADAEELVESELDDSAFEEDETHEESSEKEDSLLENTDVEKETDTGDESSEKEVSEEENK